MSESMKHVERELSAKAEHTDPHPKGAYDMDRLKIALVGCHCRYCTEKAIRQDRGRYLGLDRS